MDRDERHAKCFRLRNQRDFERVYDRRKSVADDVLVLYGCENDLAHPRLGLAVGRKVGGAVVRNRWKRLIRDAFRRARCDLPQGLDLVVVPRPRAEPTFAAVAASLDRLAKRLARKLARDS